MEENVNKEVTIREEPAVQKETKPFNAKFNMAGLLQTASKLTLTEKQKMILRAPVVEGDILIRPDGLIYLGWWEYQKRLESAFTGWALIPDGLPILNKESNQILWGFYLVVEGKFVDFAIGGQEYFPGNLRMSYADAMEGAKSNALLRTCKRLGIALELWDPEFVAKWKEKYAVYTTDRKGKPCWKKLVNPIKPMESKTPPESPKPVDKPTPEPVKVEPSPPAAEEGLSPQAEEVPSLDVLYSELGDNLKQKSIFATGMIKKLDILRTRTGGEYILFVLDLMEGGELAVMTFEMMFLDTLNGIKDTQVKCEIAYFLKHVKGRIYNVLQSVCW